MPDRAETNLFIKKLDNLAVAFAEVAAAMSYESVRMSIKQRKSKVRDAEPC